MCPVDFSIVNCQMSREIEHQNNLLKINTVCSINKIYLYIQMTSLHFCVETIQKRLVFSFFLFYLYRINLSSKRGGFVYNIKYETIVFTYMCLTSKEKTSIALNSLELYQHFSMW